MLNCILFILFSLLQLASQYNTDATVKTMVDNFDWYFIPSLNVDGYAYTWSNVSLNLMLSKRQASADTT